MSEVTEASEIQEAVAEVPQVDPVAETTKELETGTKPKKPRSAALMVWRLSPRLASAGSSRSVALIDERNLLMFWFP